MQLHSYFISYTAIAFYNIMIESHFILEPQKLSNNNKYTQIVLYSIDK